jgi:shikimate kinase
MGAGKTTIGKLLSKKMGISFFDVDDIITKTLGVDIATIFAKEGECGFRKHEHVALKKCIKSANNSVISTGGGCVLLAENRALIKKNGRVFFLNLDCNLQYERLRKDKTRPLLQTQNPQKTLQDIYTKRLPLYKKISDWEINVANFTKQDILYLILNKIQQ